MSDNSLSHTKWNYKHHIMFAPKNRRKKFWRVDTTGKHVSRIEEYIRNQIKEDQVSEQMTMSAVSPFTGGEQPLTTKVILLPLTENNVIVTFEQSRSISYCITLFSKC